MRPLAPLALAALLSLVAVACSSAPPDTMELTKGCVKTQCDVRSETDGQHCSACMSACSGASYNCNSSSACRSSCSSTTCSDSDTSTCAVTGFKATLPKTKSDELDAACKKMVKNLNACGWSQVPQSSDCDVFAVTELPERASAYLCVANLACDADPASCSPAPSTFGQTVCADANKVCGGDGTVCNKDFSDTLDIEGAWLRPDVMNALKACTTQSTCDDVRSCFQAWNTAVIR